jgi:hypothetical protein
MGLFRGFSGVKEIIFGNSPGRSGLLFKKPMAGLKSGLTMAYSGTLPFIIPAAALVAGMSPQGERVSEGAGVLAAPLGTVVGGLVGGPWGALAGTFVLDPLIQSKVAQGSKAFARMGGKVRRLEMGKGFVDTQQAYSMRQRAEQELNRSLLNARHYLGKEARMMHQ